MSHLYTEGDEVSKAQRPPHGVAVFTLYSSTVCSTCVHLHRITLFISDYGSSDDRASIVGGALERTFQPLRDQINHYLPSCTTVVWEAKGSPNHKAEKVFIYTYQALRLALKPGRTLTPSRTLTPTRGSMRPEICIAF